MVPNRAPARRAPQEHRWNAVPSCVPRCSAAASPSPAASGRRRPRRPRPPRQTTQPPYGPLQPADANGIQLPAGFTSQIVARSRQVVAGTSYVWHDAPDGGACFADGTGWIYVSNSEISAPPAAAPPRSASTPAAAVTGGVPDPVRHQQQLRRRQDAVEHLAVLRGGRPRAGSGRPTRSGGTAVARPAMGRFKHEAAAADPVRRVIYLTEDETDGRFYRFIPTTWGDLSAGTLQVLVAGQRDVRLVHLGDRPRPGRLAHRHPLAGVRREVVQRRRGLLLRQRHRAGSPPRATTGSGSSTC